MSKLLRVFFFVLGAAFTQIAGPYLQVGWDRVFDSWCGGSAALTQGKSALAKAISENQPQMFEEAKAALDKAASCKVGEALFLKALLFCNGLGVEKDVPRGRRILREVTSFEPKWALEIQANPKLCKAAD